MELAGDLLQSVRLGESLVLQGRPSEALIAFDNALKLDTRCFDAVHGKGVALASCGDVIQARDCLLRAFEIEPSRIPLVTYHYFVELLLATAPERLGPVLSKAKALYPEDPKILEACCRQALANYDLVTWESLYTKLHPFNADLERSNTKHVRLKPRHELWRVRREELNLRYYLTEVITQASLVEDSRRGYSVLVDGKCYQQLLSLLKESLTEPSGLHLTLFGLVQYYFGRISGRRELIEGSLQALAAVLNTRATGLVAYFVGLIGSELGVSAINPEECFQHAIALNPRLAEPHYELGTRLQANGHDMASIPHIRDFLSKREEAMNSTPLGRAGVRFITETNSYAFGHMTDLPRVIVMARELGLLPKYRIIWLAPEGWVANYTLLDCWREQLEIVSDHAEIAKFGLSARELELDTSFFTLPNGASVHTRIAVSYLTREWRNRGMPQIVKLSQDVVEKGESCLRQLGLPNNRWFVALHVRAAGFKGDSKVGGFNGHRLADERTYAEAVRLIGERGGYVVRLGEETAPAELQQPHVIDYAASGVKSDWMDLYILAKAKFLLGSASGLTPGAGLFGTPTIATNFCTTPYRNEPESIVVPKLIWNEHEQRLVKFREWFQPPLFEMENGALMNSLGYRFIDNTPQDIRDGVIEMFDRLEGRVKQSADDEQMQEQFKSYEPLECGRAYLARISAAYLRNNRNLL